jgi:hypothetical protein
VTVHNQSLNVRGAAWLGTKKDEILNDFPGVQAQDLGGGGPLEGDDLEVCGDVLLIPFHDQDPIIETIGMGLCWIR